jgi:hypothetical protein
MVDPSLDGKTLTDIEEKLSKDGIVSEQIIFLQGNINKLYQGGMKMIDSDISLYQTSNTIPYYPFITPLGYVSDIVREIDLDHTSYRSKKFLCFNRNMHRIHRLGIAHLAIKYNILPDGFFSFLANVHPNIFSQLRQIAIETDE